VQELQRKVNEAKNGAAGPTSAMVRSLVNDKIVRGIHDGANGLFSVSPIEYFKRLFDGEGK
jgi:hypothetical protein